MLNHIRRITRWLAAPLALFIVRRPYLRTEEVRAALHSIKHDDSLRASEPAQPPVGTYGLLTGQQWD